MEAVLGPDRQLAVCRELTKQFETVLRGSIEQVRAAVEADKNQQKGEFVLVVAGCSENMDENMAHALEMSRALQEFLSASQAARVAAKLCGVSRRDLYEKIKSVGQDRATE
jgi:16S rRNA (cytidine1402-2'-O)-methyltransferase